MNYLSMTGNAVVVGGGTGTYTVLSGLKSSALDLYAIITMMDSGGSTGRLRDQYGVLPPGDIRQALIALSESSMIWRQLFLYRFDEGDFKGHNFGNLFLAAVEKTSGNFEQGIRLAQELLRAKGHVVPVTLEKTHIRAVLKDGNIIEGEKLIDKKDKRAPIVSLELKNNVAPNKKAIEAIISADYIIVGPGDVYTSVIPNFIVPGIAQAYTSSKAYKIFVANLMNKTGQTDNMSLTDHIKIYERYLGKNPFDTVVINTQRIPDNILDRYKKHNETPIVDDIAKKNKITAVRASLLSFHMEQNSADKIERSVLRHDPYKLASVLLELFHDKPIQQ